MTTVSEILGLSQISQWSKCPPFKVQKIQHMIQIRLGFRLGIDSDSGPTWTLTPTRTPMTRKVGSCLWQTPDTRLVNPQTMSTTTQMQLTRRWSNHEELQWMLMTRSRWSTYMARKYMPPQLRTSWWEKILLDRLTPLLPHDNAQAHEDPRRINNMMSYVVVCSEAPVALTTSQDVVESSNDLI